jgi:hypothetical protein
MAGRDDDPTPLKPGEQGADEMGGATGIAGGGAAAADPPGPPEDTD